MTTSVMIKNNGPHKVNVTPIENGKEVNEPRTLEVGMDATIHIWGERSLSIVELPLEG